MSYFAFEITELKVVTLAIEADSDEEAYERLCNVMENSDVIYDAMSNAVPCDYDILPMLSTRNVGKTLSDDDYKRVMGE